MSDLPERIRSYIPQGDGYNSDFANDLSEAAEEIERLRRVEQAAREYHDYRYSTAIVQLEYSKLSRLHVALKAALEGTTR